MVIECTSTHSIEVKFDGPIDKERDPTEMMHDLISLGGLATDVKNVVRLINVARSWENGGKARENETRILPIPRTSRF